MLWRDGLKLEQLKKIKKRAQSERERKRRKGREGEEGLSLLAYQNKTGWDNIWKYQWGWRGKQK